MTSEGLLRVGALGMAITIVCVAAGVVLPIAAQQPPAIVAADIDGWIASATVLTRDGKPSEAMPLLERALAAARRLGLAERQGEALLGLGEVQQRRLEYERARSRAQEALALYEGLRVASPATAATIVTRGLARAHHLLGVVAGRMGDAAEAKRHAEQAIAAFESVDDRRGRAQATLTLLYAMSGEQNDEHLTDRIVDDARAVGDRVLEASGLHAAADSTFARGQYAQALPKLEAAAALYEAMGRLVELGTVYNSIGRVYRAHGRLDAALASQLKALSIHEKAGVSFNHMQSLNAVAVTYQALGDTQQTRAHFAKALAIAQGSGSPRVMDFLRGNLSTTLLAEGNATEAAAILEDIVARGVDAYPSTRMSELAEAHLMLGNYAQALTWGTKAIESCGSDDRMCISALWQRAEVHAAMQRRDAARADLNAAVERMEAIRARLVPADFLKQQFNVALEGLYTRALALDFGTDRLVEALETAERARARAFLDLLASRNLRLNDGAASLGTTPLTFRGASPGAAPPAAGTLASDAAVPAATAAQLAATAKRLGSTILAYWVARDRIFIWVVSPDGAVRGAQVPVRSAKLLALVRSTNPITSAQPDPTGRTSITTRGASAIATDGPGIGVWRELYDLLIKPVRSALPAGAGALLTIVPHGPLGSLAFAALQDERGRYLLESYTLHYAPAGAVLEFTARHRRTDGRARAALIVADPVPPKLSALDPPLPRLPGARIESRAIASLLTRARMTRLEGDNAHERAVRDASSGKSVLHFATHAVVKDDEPFASFLALGSGGAEDGQLTAQEIYGLDLDADLVVLSACRSAAGRVTGDGIATFARAFVYAGAASIVASQWDVADEPTNRLLPEFYRAWLGGSTKARALRAAQLHVLKMLRAGTLHIDTPAGRVSLPDHPVFWAGFALIGEPD